MSEQALIGNAEYQHYFGVTKKMTGILGRGVAAISNGNNRRITETALENIIQRLQYTARLLQYKYAFSAASLSGAQMRIHSSNFPHVAEIANMQSALQLREEVTDGLETVNNLKQSWIENVFATGKDDHHLLWKIGDRSYYDALDRKKMLTLVMPGGFEFRGENKDGMRQYSYWWATYDPVCNAPCVYVFEFLQESGDNIIPVHTEGDSRSRFIESILTFGSHHSSVSVIAHDIDRTHRHLRPKKLSKIQFEKLFSQTKVTEENFDGTDDASAQHILEHYAKEDDFILYFTVDVVVSKGEDTRKQLIFGEERVTQIFDLESLDPEAFERGATRTDSYLVMPHSVAQICDNKRWGEIFSPLKRKHTKLVYTDQGDIHAIP